MHASINPMSKCISRFYLKIRRAKYFWWNLVASKCLATYSFDVIKVVYKNDITLRHFVSSRYEIPFGLNAQMEQDRQMYQINAFCVISVFLKKIRCYKIALQMLYRFNMGKKIICKSWSDKLKQEITEIILLVIFIIWK